MCNLTVRRQIGVSRYLTGVTQWCAAGAVIAASRVYGASARDQLVTNRSCVNQDHMLKAHMTVVASATAD